MNPEQAARAEAMLARRRAIIAIERELHHLWHLTEDGSCDAAEAQTTMLGLAKARHIRAIRDGRP